MRPSGFFEPFACVCVCVCVCVFVFWIVSGCLMQRISHSDGGSHFVWFPQHWWDYGQFGLARFHSNMCVFVRSFFAAAVCSGIVVGKQARVDIHLEAAPGEQASFSEQLRTASAGFLAAGSGDGARSSSAAAGGEFGRETQSPMVWLNLHKSGAEVPPTSSSFGAYAVQRAADLKQRL